VFQNLTPAPGMTPEYRKIIDSCSCLIPVTNREKCKLWWKSIPILGPVPIENIHSWSWSDPVEKHQLLPESTSVHRLLHSCTPESTPAGVSDFQS